MSSKNFNIFAGDRSYRTNFALQFKSNRTERKFREESFTRLQYPLRGFLVFSLLALSIYFMATDCFHFDYSCRHQSLIVLAMLAIIAALGGLRFKINHFFLQIFVATFLLYFHIIFLEVYTYHTSLILMTLYSSIASYLIHQVWFLQLLYNFFTYGVLVAYLYFTNAQDLFRKPILEFVIDVAIYNLIMTTFFAFLEKGRKERWVLVETFKKSDKIFKQLYEELPYAFFVVDKSKRILYSSQHGLTLLSLFFRNCRSCNFSRMNLNIQEIIEPEYLPQVDEILANASGIGPGEDPASCFVALKPATQEYDPLTCRFSLEKENLYKFKVIQTVWKTQYAYMVVLKDYSTKKKSEKISSRAVSHLAKHLNEVIEEYDEQAVERHQLKFKSKILSKMLKIKFSVFNSLLMFHRIFAQKEAIKAKKSFNIRSSILSIIGVMSWKAKEKKCDLQLKFEQSSFPTEIFADKHLFQQTFANALSMLLEKLSNTTITIDCKLATITPEGQFILLFEFKYPRNENLSYDLLSSRLQTISPVSLNHILAENDLSFYLALIMPGIELFNGKLYAEDNDHEVILSLELLFEASGNSKAKAYPESSTFKQVNYNASGNPNKNLYFWKWKDQESPEIFHEIENKPADSIREPKPKDNVNEKKPIASSIGTKQLDELTNKLQIRSTTSDQTLSRNRMDENKIRAELQKLSMKGMKNFGSQDDILVIPAPAPNSGKRIAESQNAETKRSVLELQEEDKEDYEGTAATTLNTHVLSMNGFQNELAYDRITSAESSNSLPEIECLGKTQPWLRMHEYTLKLAITKALMDIVDEQTKDSLRKNNDVTADFIPTLEGVTVEERQDGLEIKEAELCDKTLRFLSAKLGSQRRCDDFMMFAGRFVRELEDDIERLQPINDEMERKYTSGNEGEGSALSRPRRLDSVGRKESNLKLFFKKPSRDSSFSRDSERSKEKILNERFLMSPSINKTMTLRSALSLTAKSMQEGGAFTFLSPLQGLNSQKPNLVPMENAIVQKSVPKNKLLPFDIDESHLPHYILARAVTHQRRWIGAPNKIESNTPERMFLYNDVFTILAVDDSAFVFKGLEHLPVKYKMKFEFAKNGTEALKKYLSNVNQGILYHLVLLDLQMPVMDGFETARIIRAEEANKNYPPTYICAMSAFEDPETINRTKKEGMDNFCQKPLRSEVLNNLIKSRSEQIGIPVVEAQEK